MRTKKTKTTNQNSNSLYFFSLLFVIGALLGMAIAFLSSKKLKSTDLYSYMDYGLSNFFALCFKYFKLPAAIWFSAFVKAGALVISLLLIIKAAGLSLTAAALGAGCGLKGVVYSFFLIFIQSLFIMPTYLYLAEMGTRFIKQQITLKKYFFCFLISSAFIFLAVFMEMFVSPTIMNHVF